METEQEQKCVTVWLSPETEGEFKREVERLGLTRSQVMRQLIKRWLLQREEAKRRSKRELIEEVM